MAEATTEGVPSQRTKRLLGDAIRAGVVAEGSVDRFCSLARQGYEAFDREVNTLHLPDADYERVVSESGLARVNDLASRIEGSVASLQADRAA